MNRRGWTTTEFWLASQWMALMAWAIHAVLSHPPENYPAALAMAPALVLLAYGAMVNVNNYGENRWQLKVRSLGLTDGRECPGDPARGFGFGRSINPAEEENEENE